VTLRVYDILGRVVATLVDDFEQAGYRSVSWNGRLASGSLAPSGRYLYVLETGSFKQARSMMLIK
jgi:flagellar hook assembly protein FlgD